MENTYRTLEEIVLKVNKQRVIIDTYRNGKCTKCKIDCKKEHHSLEIEYKEIRQVMRNFSSYRVPQVCYRHEKEIHHIPFRCLENTCDKCGKSGHARQMCDTFLYFWNRFHYCGYNLRTVKKNKSRLNNGGGNHCCSCLTPIKYKDAYNNQTERKLQVWKIR